MFRFSRGQGAMEYLMTHAWAILSVMIVGIVLIDTGIINLEGTTTTYTGFSKLPPILTQTEANTNGNFQTTLLNSIGNKISITDATINIDGTQTQADTPTQNVNTGAPFRLSFTTAHTHTKPGEYLQATITITYTTVIGDLTVTRTETGTIQTHTEGSETQSITTTTSSSTTTTAGETTTTTISATCGNYIKEENEECDILEEFPTEGLTCEKDGKVAVLCANNQADCGDTTMSLPTCEEEGCEEPGGQYCGNACNEDCFLVCGCPVPIGVY